MIQTYYKLTKPGIIYGNALPAIAGFLLATKGRFDLKLFLGMLIGLSLVIASGCVFNNIFDSDIDAKMDRTKNRAMVLGVIPKTTAIIYGVVLLIAGVLCLLLTSNLLTLAVSMLGFIVYVFLYTPLKRRTVHATLIGAIAGATPPVVGYVAVTGKLDPAAWILFFILVFWQMPHFYAIAIRRLKDYTDAKIPVLPVKQGIYRTKIEMVLYILGFIISASLLTVYGYTKYLYLASILLLGFIWLWKATKGFGKVDDALWAKKVFLFSLIVLTSLCVIIPIDKFEYLSKFHFG